MSLVYSVSLLLREPVGSTREYDVEDAVLVDESPRHERVAGHATFLRTNEGVLVSAHLAGVNHDRCSRCLREIEVPVRLDFDEEFHATVDPRTGAALPRPEEPEASLIDAHHELDLEDVVRQTWASALPMQPLCRPDCAGLCARCGRDLNVSACVCPPEPADERWSVLGELARKLEGS
jgi:uncharacterized protein